MKGYQEINLGLPWATDEAWQAAHGALDYLFKRYGDRMDRVREAARTVRCNLEQLYPVFDELSAKVCPTCTKVCCYEARIAYDFRDILFIRALEIEKPPYQLRRTDHEPCRYLGPGGCLLSRIRRPFICTWYYCAPMLEYFYAFPPREQRRLSQAMTQAQGHRKIMEESFIAVQMAGRRDG